MGKRKYIDLRSDTVSKPGREMMQAMMQAPLGDDVFGEDPTVNRLEEKVAELFGHEAALFCPSGTMTNQIAIQLHTQPGDEVICHALSHVYNYEGGGIARNALASTRLVHNDEAVMHPHEVESLRHDDSDWLARTSLVVAEDTSNRGGGKCYRMDELLALSDCCAQLGLAFHLDGARAWNAIVHQGHEFLRYGMLFDSISLCLSKGLGCPVGSVLLGSRDFIREGRRVRKVMGGGMRQAGILAAAGLYALEHHIQRLADDHRRATELADHIRQLPGVRLVVEPETNIVLFDVDEGVGHKQWLASLRDQGLLSVPFGKNRIRMVSHIDIDDADLSAAREILSLVAESLYLGPVSSSAKKG